MMTIPEIHEKMQEGWTITECLRGKGWKEKYPSIARWDGGISNGSEGNERRFSLGAGAVSHLNSFAYFSYEIFEKRVECTTDEFYPLMDREIKQWFESNGAELLAHYNRDWTAEPSWPDRYPHIFDWISRGKRHCVRAEIDLVKGSSKARAWHYRKSLNGETIVYEENMETVAEAEVQHRLNQGIGVWLAQNPEAYLPTAEEDRMDE